MKTIYKYHIKLGENDMVAMPRGAKILDVQTQDAVNVVGYAAVAWFLVDTDQPAVDYQFDVIGTGHRIPAHISDQDYLGTFQTSGGAFVWHVFGSPVSRPESYSHD